MFLQIYVFRGKQWVWLRIRRSFWFWFYVICSQKKKKIDKKNISRPLHFSWEGVVKSLHALIEVNGKVFI